MVKRFLSVKSRKIVYYNNGHNWQVYDEESINNCDILRDIASDIAEGITNGEVRVIELSRKKYTKFWNGAFEMSDLDFFEKYAKNETVHNAIDFFNENKNLFNEGSTLYKKI